MRSVPSALADGSWRTRGTHCGVFDPSAYADGTDSLVTTLVYGFVRGGFGGRRGFRQDRLGFIRF
jgi:hypothetical protein